MLRYSKHGTGEESEQYVSWTTLKVRDQLVDLCTDVIIQLHIILNKLGMMASFGLIWLTLGTSLDCYEQYKCDRYQTVNFQTLSVTFASL